MLQISSPLLSVQEHDNIVGPTDPTRSSLNDIETREVELAVAVEVGDHETAM